MKPIKVAVIGVGNCASSLVQGVYFYRQNNSAGGLIHDRIGGYGAGDVEFVLGVDVDARKVGKDIGEAIFAGPNCTAVFHADVPLTGSKVIMGRILDGVADHMTGMGERGFILADAPEARKHGRRAQGDRRRSAAQLPAGRIADRDRVLYGSRA
jgi:myo-inositol-1-phosphate synthase